MRSGRSCSRSWSPPARSTGRRRTGTRRSPSPAWSGRSTTTWSGTETTIGADSALHRIVEAIDAISSTASSHQRSFVVEVTGRRCGYLALAGALAGGAHYAFVPERPPDPGWEADLCALIRADREAGCRNSIVVVAEGAHDSENNPITSSAVRAVLTEQLGRGHPRDGPGPRPAGRIAERLRPVDELDPRVRRGRGAAHRRPRPHAPADRGPRQPGPRDAAGRGGVRTTSWRTGSRPGTSPTRRRCGARASSSWRPCSSRCPGAAAVPGAPATHTGGGSRCSTSVAPGMNAAARAAVRLGLHRAHDAGGRRQLPRPGRRSRARARLGDVSGWTAEGGRGWGSAGTFRRSRTCTR